MNFVFSLLIVSSLSVGKIQKCPCRYSDSCDIVPLQKDKKIVVGFMTDLGYSFFQSYEFYRLTTILLPLNDTEFLQDFVCFAHEREVAVLYRVDPTLKVVLNNSLHNQWAQETIKIVQTRYLDGINFDFQGPLDFDHTSYYTNLVKYTCSSLRAVDKKYQCSVNLPWSGDCTDIDGRCYDVYRLTFVDFFIVLLFDVQENEGKPPCYAKANSPFYRGLGSVVVYVEAGIAMNQLVVALPWYGYMYTCLSVDKYNVCSIAERKEEPFCSDLVGKLTTYKQFVDILADTTLNASSVWNSTYRSPYVMLQHGEVVQQGWYDDPKSLSTKIIAIKEMGIGGIGVYTMDCLSYIDEKQVKEMWDTLDLIN